MSIVPEPQPVGNGYPPLPAALLQADPQVSLLQHGDAPAKRRADVCNRHDVELGTPILRGALPDLQPGVAAAVDRVAGVAAGGRLPVPPRLQCDMDAAD